MPITLSEKPTKIARELILKIDSRNRVFFHFHFHFYFVLFYFILFFEALI